MKVSQFCIKNGLANPDHFGRHYVFTTEPVNEVITKVQCFAVTHFEEIHFADDPKGKTVEGPFFERRGATASNDTTNLLDEAQRVFEGTIKWDGCSDIRFYPDEGGYSHYCGRPGACDLGFLMDNAYSLAKEVMGDKVYEECFEGT